MSENNEDNIRQGTVEEQPAVQETAEEQPVAAESFEEQPVTDEAADQPAAESGDSTELTVMGSQEVAVIENEKQTGSGTKVTSIDMKKIDSGSIMDAVKCMISFFTIIRLDVGEKEMDAMERNFWLAPVLGAINGFVAFMVCLILGLFFEASALVMSVVALATVFIFSKFLHFDGLVDFGDGIVVSSADQEKHVRALKDSLIGAGGFGVALIVILISIFSFEAVRGFVVAMPSGDYPMIIIASAFIVFPLEILIKNAQVAAAAFGKPGNGMAARQVENTGISDVIYSTVVTTILVIISSLICLLVASACEFHMDIDAATVLLVGIVAGLMSIAVGFAMAHVSNRTFGFVNGDVLGATNEIARAIILLISLMLLNISMW